MQQHSFKLQLDWPSASHAITVGRSIRDHNEIHIAPNVWRPESILEGSAVLNLIEWQKVIERDLFNMPSEHPGISGRAMFAFYLRRIYSHAFNEAVKTHAQQSPAEASANIAYLLGLDWQLAAKYRDIADRDATRRRLAQAAKDPVWGKIVGRSSELRGQITVAQQHVNDLETEIRAFRVVPQYENLQNEADEIACRIRRIREDEVVSRRNLADYERSLEDAVPPDLDYLPDAYSQLGLCLDGAIQRGFDEVKDFHRAVVRNRKNYLSGEMASLQEKLASNQRERLALGDEQARILQTLNDGGALDSLTALQNLLAQERASLEALRHRYDAALALERSAADIKIDRGQLEAETQTDLRERESIINDINIRFLEYATRLYGQGREAYLNIDPTPSYLKIFPHIDSRDSRGIGNMVIFCFDLTVAVTAHRAGRGPDFLVHDSHLFDGVDERQLFRALTLVKEVAEAESLQYIVTINSDDLAKAAAIGADFSDSIIEPRLTDNLEDGGLFGFQSR